jgi:hypothetical protein
LYRRLTNSSYHEVGGESTAFLTAFLLTGVSLGSTIIPVSTSLTSGNSFLKDKCRPDSKLHLFHSLYFEEKQKSTVCLTVEAKKPACWLGSRIIMLVRAQTHSWSNCFRALRERREDSTSRAEI